MKKTLFTILALTISTQAFAGTAYVISAKVSGSEMNLMYNAADSADDTDGPLSDISICDSDFKVCMNLDVVRSQGVTAQQAVERYKDQDSVCEITIEDVPNQESHTQIVKIIAGADDCKVKIGKQLESVARTYSRD